MPYGHNYGTVVIIYGLRLLYKCKLLSDNWPSQLKQDQSGGKAIYMYYMYIQCMSAFQEVLVTRTQCKMKLRYVAYVRIAYFTRAARVDFREM